MTLLLDTHALLWWLDDNPLLSRSALEALADAGTIVFVSPVSVWEVAIKENVGKLSVPPDWIEKVEASHLKPMPITLQHGRLAGSLPLHHRDPFDRMLVAQAMAEGLTIVTRDPRIARYGVPTLRA